MHLGFSRQEYWNGVPFPSPGHLPDAGMEPETPAFQADCLLCEPPVLTVLFFNSNLEPPLSYAKTLLVDGNTGATQNERQQQNVELFLPWAERISWGDEKNLATNLYTINSIIFLSSFQTTV